MPSRPPQQKLHAFIDEAGQRARTSSSSSHFVMTAVIIPGEQIVEAKQLLARLRAELGRGENQTLHWKNFKQHSQRLRVAQTLGSHEWLTLSAVVVCKDHLTGTALDDDTAYLYTLRLLLERLSWFARDRGAVLSYTMAHIVRFQLHKLRAYEKVLGKLFDCQIAWPHLDPSGGRMEQPSRVELLQLADSAASATFAAFEKDGFGNTEPRYLQEMSRALYRRRSAPLTSYGLKMHPWGESTRAAYPWVAAL